MNSSPGYLPYLVLKVNYYACTPKINLKLKIPYFFKIQGVPKNVAVAAEADTGGRGTFAPPP